MSLHGDHGAAWRRRQRRLRSWWRHEQQTVAAVLATYQHHSAPRGPRTARTGGRSARRTTRLRSGRCSPPGGWFPTLCDGRRGGRWVRHQPPGGQHRCLRCCRRSASSSAPRSRSSTLCRWSQCSMYLSRRCWNSWWTFSHLSISALPSRSSKYPRLFVHPALLAQFSVRRRRQTSWWKCRRLSPVLRYCSGLWSRTLPFQFLLVVEGETQIFKVFSQGQGPTALFSSLERISEQIVEQTVDIPAAGGGLADFRPGQSSTSVAHSPAAWLNPEDEPVQRVFRTFSPEEKSANVTRHMGARVPGHVSSSTSSAYGPRTWVDDDTGEVWTLLTDPALGSWWYSSRTRRSQWDPPWEG